MSRAAKARLPVLVADDDDQDAGIQLAIHDRVRKNTKWKSPAPTRHRRAEARMFEQQSRDPLEFDEKPSRNNGARALGIEVQNAGEVLLSAGVQRPSHRPSLDRRRASAS